MKALFLNANASKPRCAVFQAGQLYGKALENFSQELDVEYLEVGDESPLPDPSDYDLVIFNYQHLTMADFPGEYFSHCKIAAGFLYEAREHPEYSPTHLHDTLAGQLFDLIISPDPTLETIPKIWGTLRIIPRKSISSYVCLLRKDVPIISTFGFPSPWKNLKAVVEMMNEEFTLAEFRLNFASASHQEGTPLHERQIGAAQELKAIAKPGIKISVTTHYMEDQELVSWLADSDVNIFFSYPERGFQTGGALLASADMAISSQVPLLVSDNIEARHLAGCYGDSLKYAMEHSQSSVRHFYQTWTSENFASRIDALVREYLS